MSSPAKILPQPPATETRLGAARPGFQGFIQSIQIDPTQNGICGTELESRLLELGFVEGAHVEILHQGAFGKDPIAVRIKESTIAIRRREAMAILVA